MEKVKIYTDGSSLGNPGPGGWAALIFVADKPYVLKGGELETTNNRMEMRAAIEALKYVKKHCVGKSFVIHSDSKLLIDTLTEGWKRKKNLDLWQELDDLLKSLNVEWIKVKGHANNKWNNECDRLAVSEAEQFQQKLVPEKSSRAQVEFFCKTCQKEVTGKFTWMAKAKLIRVDCEHCGKFVKFAKKTRENLDKAKGRA